MDQYSILITAGTLKLPFYRLFNLANELAKNKAIREIVIQGIGAENFFAKNSKIKCHEFIEKSKMDLAISKSDVLISHAGVGSIVNAISLAKPTILVPRKSEYNEHFDNHQIQIFEKMEQHPLFLCLDGKPLNSTVALEFIQSSKRIIKEKTFRFINQKLQQDVYDFFIQ